MFDEREQWAIRNSEIRKLYAAGITQEEIAREYELSQSMVSLIVSGKRG